jgi:hypothetical protein
MAKTTVALELEVSSKAAESSVGSFKKQLRDANQELLTLNEKFGATSKEAIEAAKKVANLKDAIGDAKQLSEAFNPDAKFNALAGAVTGAVSGFQALQGAQALFGTESKELEETLVKLNSVMALSQGLNGILAAKDAFIALGAQIKNSTVFIKANELATKAAAIVMKLFGQGVETTSTSFKVLKGAIAATGIGLLVVLIGEAVQAFQEFTSAADKAAESQKKFNDLTLKNAEDELKRINTRLDREEKFAIARAKLAGASEEEIFQIEQEYRRKKLEAQNNFIRQAYSLDEDRGDEAVAQAKKINEEGQLAELNNQLKLKQIRDKAAIDAANEADRVAKERAKKQQEQYEKELKAFQDLQEAKKAISKQSNEADDLALENAQKQFDAQAEQEEEAARKSAENKIFWEQFYANLKLKSDAELLKAEQDAAAQRVANLQSVADSTNKLADVVGKQTAAGKVLASATALINTYQGATEVIRAKSTLPEPFGTISKIANVAAIIATGLRAVKSINSVRVPGSGGGGSVAAPSLGNFSPQATTTNLNQQSINAIGNVAARAYVLETDVSGNQERIRRLNRAARIN